jgi:hypothetical protein
MSALDREHIKQTIKNIPGSRQWVSPGSTPTEVYISDAEDLVDTILRLVNLAYAQGLRDGSNGGEQR